MNRLTIEQCVRGIDTCTSTGRWDEANLMQQLLDTMRENERLRDALSECRDNMIKWGKSENDFFRYVNDALSNKESND